MRIAVVVGALALGIVAGCGSSKPDTGAHGGSGGGSSAFDCGLPPVPLEDSCGALARAECRRWDRCNQLAHASLGACVLDLEARCVKDWLKAPLAAGKVRYDGEAYACCWDDIAEKSSCLYDVPRLRAERAACTGYVIKLDPPGSKCEGPTCRGGSCRIDDRCPGVCVLYAKKGEPCTNGCEPGTLCDTGYDGATETCFGIAAAGEACGYAPTLAFCDSGSWCDAPDGSATGVCKPLPGLGEPCVSATRTCDGTTICRLDGKCGELGAVDDNCYHDWQCLPELYCTGSASKLGKCTLRAPDGGPCDTAFDNCAFPASCSKESGTCVLTHPGLGDPCDPAQGRYCGTGYCAADGRCAPGKAKGEICTAGAGECAGACGRFGLCRDTCALE
jgi:hypothetical protein